MAKKPDNQVSNPADEARAGSRGAPTRAARDAGAPPSITAPANCITPLRHGLDSLYLSQQGLVYPRVLDALTRLKLLAQNPDAFNRSLAEYEVEDHLFSVLPRGRGRFAFVLQDHWLWIELPGADSGNLPMAHCQVRSEYLTSAGPKGAIDEAWAVLDSLGQPSGPVTLSRLDLFVDFTCDTPLVEFPASWWVKRCRRRHIHEEGERITGMTFAAANAVSARIYDKTLEIQKSGKDYLRPLWAAAGWDGESPVWRLEFQVRRQALPLEMRGEAFRALPYLGTLWSYLSGNWLRLTLPSEDGTRARWPTHPAWVALQRTWAMEPDAPSFERVTKTEAPTDLVLYRAALSGLTGFMAKYQLEDFEAAKADFFEQLTRNYALASKEDLGGYIRRKFHEKTRRYHTRKRV